MRSTSPCPAVCARASGQSAALESSLDSLVGLVKSKVRSNLNNDSPYKHASSPAVLTIDVEDWFHILDSPATPALQDWDGLESRVDGNTERLLDLLAAYGVRATMFWLGWAAERHPDLVRQCVRLGHEVASHGYAHLLAYQVGRKAFAEDVRRAKAILEDLTGCEVCGYRAAGFSTKEETRWTFEEILAAGHTYDSSVFPAVRGHGGMAGSPMQPHVIETAAGPLVEIPQSVVGLWGRRISFFGGGYLRLAPWSVIRWGAQRLAREGRPLIVYVHPREIDPYHPRLPLTRWRRFKSYVNLQTTQPKLARLLAGREFVTLGELARRVSRAGPRTTDFLSPKEERKTERLARSTCGGDV